jgi:hypothetical protein
MRNALFVGGPYNGNVRAIQQGAGNLPKVYYFPIYGENGHPIEGKYFLHTYQTSHGEALFYVSESIPIDKVQECIILVLLENSFGVEK